MTRERHIYELERQLLFGESMCPASKKYWKEHKDEVLEAVKNTKYGEWINYYQDGISHFVGTCSACGNRNDIPPIEAAHYCPSCGAKMKGVEDEID